MGNRDFRVEAPRMSRRERMNRYRQLVDRQLVSLKGLWPVPSDYAGLRHSLGKDLLAGVTVAVVGTREPQRSRAVRDAIFAAPSVRQAIFTALVGQEER